MAGACAPTSNPGGSASENQGNKAESLDKSLSLVLPTGFVTAVPESLEYSQVAKTRAGSPAIQAIQAIKGAPAIQLLAIDLEGVNAGAEFVANLNLVVLPAPQTAPNPDLMPEAQEAAKGLFGDKPDIVDVLETKAGRVARYAGVTKAGTDTDHYLAGAMFLRSGKRYVVSLSGPVADKERLQKDLKAVLDSVKFN